MQMAILLNARKSNDTDDETQQARAALGPVVAGKRTSNAQVCIST